MSLVSLVEKHDWGVTDECKGVALDHEGPVLYVLKFCIFSPGIQGMVDNVGGRT